MNEHHNITALEALAFHKRWSAGDRLNVQEFLTKFGVDEFWTHNGNIVIAAKNGQRVAEMTGGSIRLFNGYTHPAFETNKRSHPFYRLTSWRPARSAMVTLPR